MSDDQLGLVGSGSHLIDAIDNLGNLSGLPTGRLRQFGHFLQCIF